MAIASNNIYIVGAGAIGKALSVFLQQNHKDVTLIRASVDESLSYTEKISVILNDGSETEAEIPVSTLNNFTELNGLIILTNKSYGNERMSTLLKGKTGDSPIVILQNGLGVENVFTDAGYPEIYRCVLFATSQITEENKIRFKPVAPSAVGVIRGSYKTLEHVVETIDTPVFSFKAELDIQKIIWKKAIANSVFNSVCPLLETDNGIFHRDENVFALASRIISECVKVANLNGIPLTTDEITESLLLISHSSDGQLISTLQDIRHKRKTEIETLNFEIVKLAALSGREDLVTETRLLGELVKLKSMLT